MTRYSSCGRGLSGDGGPGGAGMSEVRGGVPAVDRVIGDGGPGGAGMSEGCYRLAYRKGRRLRARMRFETGLVVLLLLTLAAYVRWFR